MVLKGIISILSLLKDKKGAIALFVVTNLLSVIFSMISLALLIPFLNLLFGKDELVTVKPALNLSMDSISLYFKYFLSSIVINNQNNKLWALAFICVAVLIAIILKNLFLYISRYTLNPLRNSVVRKMRAAIFQKMLSLPIGYFSNERKGDIMARMTNDVREVEESIISTVDLLFSVPFTILFYLVFMLSLSIELCIFLFLFLPIGGFIIGKVSKKLKAQSTQSSERMGNLLSIIDETISGLRIIKGFGAEKIQQLKFTMENNAIFKLNNNIAKRRELASPMSETLAIVILCGILLFGGKLVLVNKSIEAGTFIMFILVFTQLIDPLKKFSQIAFNIQRGNASLARINQILDAPIVVDEAISPKSISFLKSNIELRNVNFSYGEKQILKNINLIIPQGKTIALVGASGSGKSTLVDLIPRFHDCTSGEVLIDGINIKEYLLKDVRALMGIVSQEAILFNDSIENNIALAQSNASQEALINAAKIANAHEFILSKENAYQTNIGDRGNKLSGGEKQRLTIARAVLKNPPILILDEATSSLDTTSEKVVQDAINNIMKDRTCIVIAHRLSTIKNADLIVVMDHGCIVETGTHESLLKLNGAYEKLVNLQQLNK